MSGRYGTASGEGELILPDATNDSATSRNNTLATATAFSIELGHRFFQAGWLFGPQLYGRVQHDPAVQPAPAVGERDVTAGQYAVIPVSVHDRDLLDHLGPIAAVTAGVHVHAPTDGAGHTHEDMQPGKAGLGCPSRGKRGGETRPVLPAEEMRRWERRFLD